MVNFNMLAFMLLFILSDRSCGVDNGRRAEREVQTRLLSHLHAADQSLRKVCVSVRLSESYKNERFGGRRFQKLFDHLAFTSEQAYWWH